MKELNLSFEDRIDQLIYNKGKELQARREKLGLTRADVARLAQVQHAQVKSVEESSNDYTFRTISKIHLVLDSYEAGAKEE